MNDYARQDRGTPDAYHAYYAGMDASMRQKVALTTAHFPVRGRIADMGCGSGSGTFDLAALYESLDLVGVDINPMSIEYASGHYRRDNLRFLTGDIADPVFEAESLDGILDSSVLHHVTSFNGFDVRHIQRTLDNQTAQLKIGGVIIIRDFVVPTWRDTSSEDPVLLDLPTGDGTPNGTIRELSTAALFAVFARDFRSSVNPAEGVPFERLDPPAPGFARFRLAARAATEFLLRKDYRDDWAAELLEEYTYFTKARFEAEFRARGLRIVCSTHLWNPWIVRNRYEGKVRLFRADGRPLGFPPTNYLIVGERVAPDEGVHLVERATETVARPSFLIHKAFRHTATNGVFELVERPNRTLDILPWFESGGRLFVIAKKDFPRPVINAGADEPRLDDAFFAGYITEPLAAIVAENEPLQDSVRRTLAERAGIALTDIRELGRPTTYFTSPGGVNECVTAVTVEIAPFFELRESRNYTAFAGAGDVRALDALQSLRAAHVGGMVDARLEINIYRLLLARGHGAGAWIGDTVAFTAQAFAVLDRTVTLRPMTRETFEEIPAGETTSYLTVRRSRFEERSADGGVLAERMFEYVVPSEASRHTALVLPVIFDGRTVSVGLEERDLPAVQQFTGSSRIAVCPAVRLPRDVTSRNDIPAHLNNGLETFFGLPIRKWWELGGAYFPTPGVTPEIVYPFIAELTVTDASGPRSLIFAPLDELLSDLDAIHDAHTLIAILRLAHALGRL